MLQLPHIDDVPVELVPSVRQARTRAAQWWADLPLDLRLLPGHGHAMGGPNDVAAPATPSPKDTPPSNRELAAGSLVSSLGSPIQASGSSRLDFASSAPAVAAVAGAAATTLSAAAMEAAAAWGVDPGLLAGLGPGTAAAEAEAPTPALAPAAEPLAPEIEPATAGVKAAAAPPPVAAAEAEAPLLLSGGPPCQAMGRIVTEAAPVQSRRTVPQQGLLGMLGSGLPGQEGVGGPSVGWLKAALLERARGQMDREEEEEEEEGLGSRPKLISDDSLCGADASGADASARVLDSDALRNLVPCFNIGCLPTEAMINNPRLYGFLTSLTSLVGQGQGGARQQRGNKPSSLNIPLRPGSFRQTGLRALSTSGLPGSWSTSAASAAGGAPESFLVAAAGGGSEVGVLSGGSGQVPIEGLLVRAGQVVGGPATTIKSAPSVLAACGAEDAAAWACCAMEGTDLQKALDAVKQGVWHPEPAALLGQQQQQQQQME